MKPFHYISVAVIIAGLVIGAGISQIASTEAATNTALPHVEVSKNVYRFRDPETGVVCYKYEYRGISCANDLNSNLADTTSETDGYVVVN